MHFNCDFHPCALTKAQREARIPPPPLSAASGAAPTSLCIDLPKVSLFQLPVRPNRPEINVPPVASSDARIRSPLLLLLLLFSAVLLLLLIGYPMYARASSFHPALSTSGT